jgi:hypothetical protein
MEFAGRGPRFVPRIGELESAILRTLAERSVPISACKSPVFCASGSLVPSVNLR